MLNTPYDDVFRTLLNDCKALILPVLNEVFGETYTGEEEITFSPNEFFLTQQDGRQEKRVTDSCFVVRADKKRTRYHLECESWPKKSVIVRIFEYDAQIALSSREQDGYELIVNFPNTAVIALRAWDTVPDKMRITIRTPGSNAAYDVPVLKTQKYTVDELFEKQLFFLLPFYIFSHESRLSDYDDDPEGLQSMMDDFVTIRERMGKCIADGRLGQYEAQTILFGINTVTKAIARDHDAVLEGVKDVMGGRILEYEAKDILRRGQAEGRTVGLREGRIAGLKEGRTVGLREGHTAGLKEGRTVGLKEGQAKGEARFAQLTNLLLTDGRFDELKQATTDPQVREALYREYGLKPA